MIFLIEYNRPKGALVTLLSFTDAEQTQARNQRLEIELDLNRKGIDHEVVA